MTLRIEDLARPVDWLDPETGLLEAADRMTRRSDLPGMPVALDGLVVGIVSRGGLLTAIAAKAGGEDLADTPVTRVMQRDPVMVDSDERAVVVARRVSQLAPERLRAGILSVRGQACRGLLEAGDLIQALASENTAVTRTRAIDRDQAGEMAGRLRRLQAEQRELLAVIGHELRTPLNAVMGHAERLQRTAGNGMSRESGQAIMQGCVSLDQILGRLLETGRANPAGRTPEDGETIRVKTLGAEIEALWSPRAAETGTRFKLITPRHRNDPFVTDGGAIRQVLNNLISNALKYAGGSSVTLTLELRQAGRRGEFVACVEDGGRGIADADKQAIFNASHRIDDTAALAPGHGLGLHIARQTARSMGGDLSVLDSQTGGAAFELRLPVREPSSDAGAGPAPLARRQSVELGELLLVEDHAPSLALARSALEAAGWKVDIALNLAQAARRLAHKPYQAIICDIHLPDGDGDSFIRGLRSGNGPNQQTPAMALSADSSPERRTACERAGFALTALKPLRGSQLVALTFDMLIASAGSALARQAG